MENNVQHSKNEKRVVIEAAKPEKNKKNITGKKEVAKPYIGHRIEGGYILVL